MSSHTHHSTSSNNIVLEEEGNIFDAVKRNDLEAVKLCRAQILAIDGLGNSPLYYSCLYGFTEIIYYLCENGAKDCQFHRCWLNALRREELPYVLKHKEKSHLPKSKVDKATRNINDIKPAFRAVCKKKKWTDNELEDYFVFISDPEKRLLHLDMRKCLIGLKGAHLIAEVLQTSPSMTDMFLFKNGFGDIGINVIAKGLRSPCILTSLNVCGNEITSQGALAIANCLRERNQLVAIDMNCNNIGDEGAEAIAQALTINTSLETLSMRENQLTDRACDSFIRIIENRDNKKVWLINLWGNREISEDKRLLLNELCHQNKRDLGELDVEGCSALFNSDD